MTDQELTTMVQAVARAEAERHFRRGDQPISRALFKALYAAVYTQCIVSLMKAVGEERCNNLDGVEDEVLDTLIAVGYQTEGEE